MNAVAGKLQLRASDLNKQNIVNKLLDRGWNQEETAMLQQTLNECEVKLYTPDLKESDLQRIMKDAELDSRTSGKIDSRNSYFEVSSVYL